MFIIDHGLICLNSECLHIFQPLQEKDELQSQASPEGKGWHTWEVIH